MFRAIISPILRSNRLCLQRVVQCTDVSMILGHTDIKKHEEFRRKKMFLNGMGNISNNLYKSVMNIFTYIFIHIRSKSATLRSKLYRRVS